MTSTVEPKFEHLFRMTDDRGTFEHARYGEPRRAHGYCTDDLARVLVVAAREPLPAPAVPGLARTSLRFLIDAQGDGGGYQNRSSRRGRWEDRPTLGDCWGRSIWGLGTAASHSEDGWLREVVTAEFERAVRQRSPYPRAMAFAALGAAKLLAVEPHHRGAHALLTDAADGMVPPHANTAWPWPEARLRYANAVLPEAMVAAGAALDRPMLLQHGLDLLAWLLDHKTVDSHLSVTPAGGAGPGDIRPVFDQQPIEVAVLADACARRRLCSRGERRRRPALDRRSRRRKGLVPRRQRRSARHVGPGHGGWLRRLHTPGGANLNQGTESTLALLSTLQHSRRLVMVSR